MSAISRLGLQTRAYLGAGIATAVLAVLAVLFVLALDSQKRALESIENEHLARSSAFATTFSELSHAHAKIFEALATASTTMDEEALYQRTKPNLVKIHAIAERLRSSTSHFQLSASEARTVDGLLQRLDRYRASAAKAIEMATVNVDLARVHIADANVAYTEVNDDFLSLVEGTRANARAAIGAALETAKDQTLTFDIVVAIGSLALLGFGWAVSRALVRDLTGMTAAMTRLAEGDTATAIERTGRADELGAMARALAVFRDNLIRLRRTESDLRRAHDDLEIRVNERTRELHHANVELEAQIEELARTEAALRDSEQRIRDVTANMPGLVFQKVRHPDGRVEIPFISDGFFRVHDVSREDVQERPQVLAKLIHPEDLPRYVEVVRHAVKTLEPGVVEFRGFVAGGGTRWFRSELKPRRRDDGAVVWEEIAIDITREKLAHEDRRKLEGQLRQSQKLESLGTLAGGMAHEFNNMLVPIMGMAELAMAELPEDSRPYRNLTKVVENAERAAELVRKILTFSRSEDADAGLEVCELRSAVESAVGLLRSVLPATIVIQEDLAAAGINVGISAAQVQQILMNLGTNAAHAIEGKVGTIRVSLAAVTLAAGYRGKRIQLRPGPYAKLSVSDTGCGMDEATLARIFDPFFTTKEVGKGTGLGLTVTASIVGTLGGGIEVTSEPGRGTTFDLYLPVASDAAAAPAANDGGAEPDHDDAAPNRSAGEARV
jgi:signal transduction histidine kinase/HAMP domain-containing protein